MSACIVLGATPIVQRVASAMRCTRTLVSLAGSGDDITAPSATCDTPVENGTSA